jgi:thiamine pyrophosphate-dependent acetolactate synthase large subunit-like protein
MTVSDQIIEILHEHGVRHLFGIPGDAINDVTDSLRRTDKLEFIQVRHEEAGAFAASAQAKLTGNLAACLGTAGPGAVHLLNGLYDAKLDHAPLIAITGQVETGSIGTSYHQEVRLERLFSDVAVYSQTVVTPRQIPDVVVEACHAAIARRGVAHISVPADLSGQHVRTSPFRSMGPIRPRPAGPPEEELRTAAELIDDSSKIGVLAGIGCRGAVDELIAFADKIGAPIARSLRAKEIIDDGHPMCVGGLGMLGGSPALKTMQDCDLLIMVGTDFPYRDFYPEDATVIQIDVDPTQIGKRHRVDVPLAGHARPTLKRLTELCAPATDTSFLQSMQVRMVKWLKAQEKVENSADAPIEPARAIVELGRAAPADCIFTCDTGTATAWTARHLRLRDQQRYTLSGGLASMGYALPAAIGAQLAYPDARVAAITGDGGISILMAELLTAVRYRLPIVVVVLNNAKLAFISMEQEAAGLPEYGTTLTNPNFADIASACGGKGFRVERPEDLESAFTEAFACDRLAVIDVVVDPDALIVPPKVTLGDAAKFGLAKVRETFTSDEAVARID